VKTFLLFRVAWKPTVEEVKVKFRHLAQRTKNSEFAIVTVAPAEGSNVMSRLIEERSRRENIGSVVAGNV
jgi:hypothetical protein